MIQSKITDQGWAQGWATDFTYIPMARGFVYLVAVVDWFTRRVLSHRVAITMKADFCIEAMLNELAVELGAALGQERLYVAFCDRTWILDAGEREG